MQKVRPSIGFREIKDEKSNQKKANKQSFVIYSRATQSIKLSHRINTKSEVKN